MTLIEKIDKLYEDLQSKPLSYILPILQTIALECKDYDGFCIQSYWLKPISKEKEANIALRGEMHSILLREGLSADKVKEVENLAFETYLSLRTIEKEKLFVFSVKEMENLIKDLDEYLNSEVPNGLAPLDVYAYNERLISGKAKISEKKMFVMQQYDLLFTYITTKLADYRQRAGIVEKRKAVEKSIINTKNVFIIHGHDEAKRRELELILRDEFGLIPIVLQEQPDQGLTIIEKFEKYASTCSYAFALFTPDDIVSNGGKQYFQARPNVIFELGWFYANLGRSRVCILDQASEESKIFSDLQGVLRMQFNEKISEKYIEIERELKTLGII